MCDGLIGLGDRKSVQPMAVRLAPGDYDQSRHFVAAGVWDAAPCCAHPGMTRSPHGSRAGLLLKSPPRVRTDAHATEVPP
jgi:hypothetical protein